MEKASPINEIVDVQKSESSTRRCWYDPEAALSEVKEFTPKMGFNLCSIDDFSPMGDCLCLIDHFDTKEEAEEAQKKRQDKTVIYGPSS